MTDYRVNDTVIIVSDKCSKLSNSHVGMVGRLVEYNRAFKDWTVKSDIKNSHTIDGNYYIKEMYFKLFNDEEVIP